MTLIFWTGSRFNQVSGFGSGYGIRIWEGKNDPQNRKKVKKFHFLKCWFFPAVNFIQFLVIKKPWIRIRMGVRPKMLDPESYESGSEAQLLNWLNSPCWRVYYITARLSRGLLILHICQEGRHPHQNVRLVAALWNRNYFLRFRFRLLKSYVSGSSSSSISRP